MKTVLITGGAGYIGSHAVKYFLQKGYKVVVIDNLSRGYKQAIEILQPYGNLQFYQNDLRDKDAVRNIFVGANIDAVMHFAALCSVEESMAQPELYFENNVYGTLNLLEAMRVNNVTNIIFSSTCATYGETKYLPVDEKHPLDPANPYGESKLMAEKMLKWYGSLYGMHYVILRYFNVCGTEPEGIIGDSKRPSVLLMQNAVRGALNIEKFKLTCPLVNTPDGTPIRDYIDVNDLISAHFESMQYLDAGGSSDVFNLGNGKGYSVKQIVSKVEEITATTIPEERAEPRKGEYEQIYADPTKAKTVLKFAPIITLEDSIKSLKNWYEKYPNGYSY